METYLLFAYCFVLIASVAQNILVCTGIAAQTRFAGLVEEMEDYQGGDPQNDAKAACNDTIGIARAYRSSEGAFEGQREYSDRGKEVGCCNGEEYYCGREVGVGRPDHRDLAAT